MQVFPQLNNASSRQSDSYMALICQVFLFTVVNNIYLEMCISFMGNIDIIGNEKWELVKNHVTKTKLGILSKSNYLGDAIVRRNLELIDSNWFSLREKCPNTEFFWSIFSSIRTEYGDLRI